ncbi:MAG: ABC-F family ATP-binding cassette domain-containing protein [Candidatus Egerieousia sp.]
MITVQNVTVSFGGFNLLDDISLHIGDNDKLGLVGKNGAGKSTLLKIIYGLQHPTSGSVMMTKGEKLGYLPQQMEHAKDKTVIEEALKAFDYLFELHDKIERVTKELAERTDYESASYNKLIIELNNLNDRAAVMESEPPRSQAEKVLVGLGFKPSEFDRPTKELSQGWNMRIELAKVLLSKPDALLLDEPTNHLDIESIQWFEDYLKSFRGSVILISHDRKFLDNITKRTVEIMLGKVHDYKVPYTHYKQLRKERMEQQRAAYENQQRMIEKTQEFIDRFRYKPTKSNQVQSRIKQLDKLERIEVDLEDKSALSVKFPPAPRSGQVVFKTEDASIGYGDKVIVSGMNIVVERGEKVAFVGRNGEGKSTAMKVITGELETLAGSASLGYNVNLGYFAQNQEDILDKNDTVFETLDRIAVGDVRTKVRDILGAFLFKGEDIDKKVAVLSGGERARLAMAKLILKPYNLLALDEPTNHMDLISKDILKQALLSYDGTLILVSHDRDFLDGLVDKAYEFRDGKVKEHLGGIEPYLEHLKKQEGELFKGLQHNSRVEGGTENSQADSSKSVSSDKNGAKGASPMSESAVKSASKSVASDTSAKNARTSNGASAQGTVSQVKLNDSQQYRAESKEARRKKKEIEKVENEIAELDHKLAEIEGKLSQNHTPEEITELSAEYESTRSARDAKMDEWLLLSES